VGAAQGVQLVGELLVGHVSVGQRCSRPVHLQPTAPTDIVSTHSLAVATGHCEHVEHLARPTACCLLPASC
jgi:hypothetical protein